MAPKSNQVSDGTTITGGMSSSLSMPAGQRTTPNSSVPSSDGSGGRKNGNKRSSDAAMNKQSNQSKRTKTETNQTKVSAPKKDKKNRKRKEGADNAFASKARNLPINTNGSLRRSERQRSKGGQTSVGGHPQVLKPEADPVAEASLDVDTNGELDVGRLTEIRHRMRERWIRNFMETLLREIDFAQVGSSMSTSAEESGGGMPQVIQAKYDDLVAKEVSLRADGVIELLQLAQAVDWSSTDDGKRGRQFDEAAFERTLLMSAEAADALYQEDPRSHFLTSTGRPCPALSVELSRSADRAFDFACDFSWPMLSICAHSATFRDVLRLAKEDDWNVLKEWMELHQESIEPFAKMRNIDWEQSLTFLGIEYNDNRHIRVPNGAHPHLYSLYAENELRPSRTADGTLRANIEECWWDESDWRKKRSQKRPPHPHRKEPEDDACIVCKAEDCACTMHALRRQARLFEGNRIELFQDGIKGTGIRALQRFRRGDYLAEYVGEIRKQADGHYVYERRHEKSCIDSGIQGNWTRFINHSCDAKAKFVEVVVGEKTLTLVQADRDIDIFEDVTVDYGERYFVGHNIDCKCGVANCKFRTEAQRKVLAKKLKMNY